jgi:hypothetical protein
VPTAELQNFEFDIYIPHFVAEVQYFTSSMLRAFPKFVNSSIYILPLTDCWNDFLFEAARSQSILKAMYL